MSDLKNWSTLAASNNASVPNGWPEGMAPSGVNDSARELMGAVRRWYDDAQWTDLGHTPTYVSTLTFTLAGDKTGIYSIGRRIRAKVGSSTLYGTIESSTYTAATGIYTSLDTGGFTSSLTAVAVSILTPTNGSIPANISTGTLSANAVASTVVTATNISASTISSTTVTTLGLNTSTINENTANAGVTIDSCLIKDGVATTAMNLNMNGELEASGTTSCSLSLGTVTTGDRIFVTMGTDVTVSGAQPEALQLVCAKASGTATIEFMSGTPTMEFWISQPTNVSLSGFPTTSGICKVTGGGDLALNANIVSYGGGSAVFRKISLGAFFLKKA